jgi:hypothetical protein
MTATVAPRSISTKAFTAWWSRLWRALFCGRTVSVGCGGAFFVDDVKATDRGTGRDSVR